MNTSLRVFIEGGKLIAAAIAGLTAMGSVYVSFVTLVGGRVIPWESAAEIQAMMDISVRASEARTDAKFNRVFGYVDNLQCADYVDRYRRAQMSLARNPHDQTAQDLLYVSSMMIATIPSCHV